MDNLRKIVLEAMNERPLSIKESLQEELSSRIGSLIEEKREELKETYSISYGKVPKYHNDPRKGFVSDESKYNVLKKGKIVASFDTRKEAHAEIAKRNGHTFNEDTSDIFEATVSKKKYPWGNMITVHDGARQSFPLHPEHQEKIKNLKDGQETSFTDETKARITVKRDGDKVRFTSNKSQSPTVIDHKHFLSESVNESVVGHGKYEITTSKKISGMGEGEPSHVSAKRSKLDMLSIPHHTNKGTYGGTVRVSVKNTETGDTTYHHVYQSDAGNTDAEALVSIRTVGKPRAKQEDHEKVLKNYISGKKVSTLRKLLEGTYDLNESDNVNDVLDHHALKLGSKIKTSAPRPTTYKSDGKPIPGVRHVVTDASHREIFDALKRQGFDHPDHTRRMQPDKANGWITRTNHDSMETSSEPLFNKQAKVSVRISQEHGGKTKVHFAKY